MPANSDFTTLLVNHFVTLRAANAQNAKDLSTAVTTDIPAVRTAQADASKDTNTDYHVWLQTHA